MNGLFGVIGISLSTVGSVTKKFCSEKEYRYLYLEGTEDSIKKIKKAHLIVIPGFRLFKLLAKDIIASKAIVVIVDAPLHLNEIDCLEFLDAKLIPGKSYKWQLHKPDWKRLFKLIEENAGGRLKPIKFELKAFDLIPTLIQNQVFSDFLDIYNTYAYRCLDSRKRVVFQKHFFARMFGGDHTAFVKATKNSGPQKGFGKQQYHKIIEKIESDYGKNLTLALKESILVKDKNYKKLAKKHNVDVYDIRFLIKSRNKIQKPIGKMSEIVKGTIDKHRSKIKI